MNKNSPYRLMVLFLVSGLLGTPSFAQDGSCGAHTYDDLEITQTAEIWLYDGFVRGTAIPDQVGSADLFVDGDKLDLFVDFPGAPLIEFSIERVDPSDVPSFAGTSFGTRISDIGRRTGCDNAGAFPKYIGRGYWISDDGVTVPATIEVFLWISRKEADGRLFLTAMGIMESRWLSGKLRITDLGGEYPE